MLICSTCFRRLLLQAVIGKVNTILPKVNIEGQIPRLLTPGMLSALSSELSVSQEMLAL